MIRSIIDFFRTVFAVGPYWLKKINPDIVHLNTSSLLAFGIAAKKFKIPVVWHIREPLSEGYLGIRRWFVKMVVKKCSNLILPICINDAKPWAKESKTHVLYNAVDLNLFNILTVKPRVIAEGPKILFLGGLSKEKGTLLIFEVFKKLLGKIPDAKLLVAGYFERTLKPRTLLQYYFPTERYKREVFKFLEEIAQNVVFLGPIKDVPSVMLASDVVVFPATVGHFARPVIEAGFMKKVVVASKLAPLDELVIDGQTGFLIEHTDVDQWVDKLEKLLLNNDLRFKMSEKAFQYCYSKFTITSQIQAVSQYYSELIGDN